MDEIRKLMRQLTRMAQSYTARQLKDTGLSPGQTQALRIANFHQDINQQSLADHLGIDKAAMARIVMALEEKGYVQRSPGDDRREKLVALTCGGRSVIRELVAFEAEFYEYIFGQIEGERMEIFLSALREAHARAKYAKDCGLPGKCKEDDKSCTC